MRSTTTVSLFAFCALVIGCSQESKFDTGYSPEDSSTEGMGDTGIEQIGDNDSQDTGEIDTEPIDQIILEIEYTTEWSSDSDFEIEPGQGDINFGAWTFQSGTGDDVHTQDLTVMGYVDADGDGVFSSLEERGINPADYFTVCWLEDASYGSVFAGPVGFDERGWIHLVDDFTVGTDRAAHLIFKCDVSEDAGDLKYTGFAFGIKEGDVISDADSVEWLAHNMAEVEGGYVATLAAYVNNNYE